MYKILDENGRYITDEREKIIENDNVLELLKQVLEFDGRTLIDDDMTIFEENGWQGIDANLAISLLEYGFLFKENDDGSYDFIYGINFDCAADEYVSFDKSTNFKEDDLDPEVMDSDTEEDAPFYQKVYDATCYCGSEDVFGTSYHHIDLMQLKEALFGG